MSPVEWPGPRRPQYCIRAFFFPLCAHADERLQCAGLAFLGGAPSGYDVEFPEAVRKCAAGGAEVSHTTCCVCACISKGRLSHPW